MGWMTTYKAKSQSVLDFFIQKGVFRWSDDNLTPDDCKEAAKILAEF